MSDALDYLLSARPEAMKSYFGFLKQAGRHLDPKTRAIISVITKVDNQTEAGFRQYLTRALREGVTADEILDGLLVAFPTLGLSKIIWAMDILLAMDIPEFRPENLGCRPDWHELAAITELEQNSVTYKISEGRGFFIYNEGADNRVYEAVCPHQSTNIPAEAIEGCFATCPKHKWRFDLKSGACVENGDKPLKALESKIVNNKLHVFL